MKKYSVWNFLFKNKLSMIICVVLIVSNVMFSVSFAIVFQKFIDAVTSESYEDYIFYVISTILIILGLSFTNYAAKKTYYLYERNTMINIKYCIFSSVLSKSSSAFHKFEENDYINYLTQCITEIKQNFFDSLFYMVYDILMFLFGIIAVFLINLKMGLIILMMTILNLMIPFMLKRKILSRTDDDLRKNIEMTGYLKNILHSFQTIRIYGISDKMNQNYNELNLSQEYTNYFLNRIISFSNSLIYFLNYITVSIPWFIGAYLVIQGEFSIGVLMGISQLNNNVASPLNDFFTRLNSFVSGKHLCDKILDVIEERGNNKMLLDKEIFSISLSNISLSIGTKLILHDISLTFLEKKKYLIIGKSGSGKSTILKLISSFFDNYNGEIKINDVNLKEMNDISNIIHMISQDTDIFEDTILFNLTLYDDIDENKVINILKKVGLSNLISRLHDVVHIDELSGGELQRISIARALLHPCPILLIDEACSSLDVTTGYQIESLLLSTENQMIIEVAHRIYKNLLPLYDEIIWVNEGEIFASGSYNNMLNIEEFRQFINFE